MRDPVDTCVSCFSKLFATEQNHTYDLEELGRYHRRYQELMAHWRAVLPPGRIPLTCNMRMWSPISRAKHAASLLIAGSNGTHAAYPSIPPIGRSEPRVRRKCASRSTKALWAAPMFTKSSSARSRTH